MQINGGFLADVLKRRATKGHQKTKLEEKRVDKW